MTYPNSTFSVTHRVEVAVSEEVFRKFGHTPEYVQFTYKAAGRVQVSGQDRYSYVIEWGESHSIEECGDFAREWEAQILQWERLL